jgi:hypothetical protein
VVAWLQPRILESEKEATHVFAVDVHCFVSHKDELAECIIHAFFFLFGLWQGCSSSEAWWLPSRGGAASTGWHSLGEHVGGATRDRAIRSVSSAMVCAVSMVTANLNGTW